MQHSKHTSTLVTRGRCVAVILRHAAFVRMKFTNGTRASLTVSIAVIFSCVFLLFAGRFEFSTMLSKTSQLRLWSASFTDNDQGRSSLPLFRQRPLVIWNTDCHPSPSADIRGFVEPMGVRMLQQIYDYERCRYFDLCQSRDNVKVLTAGNIYAADDERIKSEFYAAYKSDPVMSAVDAFLCTDVIATCQLYMQFNKTIIIVATNRYYVIREDLVANNRPSPRWQRWTDDLKRIASDSRNIVAANSLYDVKFMRYFTGIEPIYIPSFCGYTNASYNPTNASFIIQKNRFSVLENWLLQNLSEICRHRSGNCQVKLGHMPTKYTFSDLASYRGIVHIPYQVSTMSLFEQYRMNIPLFFPSKRLLIKWDLEYWILKDRTRPGELRDPPSPPHDPSQDHLPNPNDEHNATALEYWLQFADYYTLPHIQHFDSVEHLAEMLCRSTSVDLLDISKRMQEFNVKQKAELTEQWKQIMMRVAKQSPNHRSPV